MLGISKTKHKSAKVGSVSQGSLFMPKVIVSVIALLSSVNPVYIVFFPWELLQSKKDCSDHLPGAMREGEFFLISL